MHSEPLHKPYRFSVAQLALSTRYNPLVVFTINEGIKLIERWRTWQETTKWRNGTFWYFLERPSRTVSPSCQVVCCFIPSFIIPVIPIIPIIPVIPVISRVIPVIPVIPRVIPVIPVIPIVSTESPPHPGDLVLVVHLSPFSPRSSLHSPQTCQHTVVVITSLAISMDHMEWSPKNPYDFRPSV